MQLPVMIRGDSGKRLLQGFAIGALATMIAGFSWGGWTLGSTTADMVRVSAAKAKVDALAPICVDRFQRDASSAGNMTALMKASSWQRGDIVEKGGWATFGGDTRPDTTVAKACAEMLANLKT